MVRRKNNIMTLRKILDDDVQIEGFIKIASWSDDGSQILHYDGDSKLLKDFDTLLDREILYVFPYLRNDLIAAICIEIEN